MIVKLIASTTIALLAFSSAVACTAEPTVNRYTAAHERLMRMIDDYAGGIGETADPEILSAMRSVPRHLFIPPSQRDAAYQNRPLPIGQEQTISQPSLVALMTHLLRPDEDDVVLEVGTGSGYQAAVLSELVDKVYSIEIVGELAQDAEQRLDELGYDNVEVRHGDGYLGWPEHAPFDSIIVTAGADHVPDPLVEQLKPGGRMVIPVGPAQAVQELRLITKQPDGSISETMIGAVQFVPLTREPR